MESSICITPEDTIILIKHLYKLLSELFSDHNYLNELLRYRKVTRPENAKNSLWPKKSRENVKSKKGKAKKEK